MYWRFICVAIVSCILPLQVFAASADTSAKLRSILQQISTLSSQGVTGEGNTPNDRAMRSLLHQANLLTSPPIKGAARPIKNGASPPPSDIQRAQEEYFREHGIPTPPPPAAKTKESFCDPPNNLYVRADRLDTYLYGIQSLDAAKGASISFTNDSLTGHRTTAISGIASYVVLREACLDPPKRQTNDNGYLAGYAIAPWVYGNGSITNFATKAKPDQSALKFGVDAQYAWIGGAPFDAHYVTLSPYYQTDFLDQARVYGFTASWQPLWADLHLGGALGTGNPYLYWFWQFAAEADLRRVDVPGMTQLHRGQSAWIGSTARLHLFLLPSVFNHRLHADGTFKEYWDASSSVSIYEYIAALAYNLTDDGNASISIEYSRGTDKDTLNSLNQYVVKLNAKY